MNIPDKKKVISEVEKTFDLALNPIPGKRIIYEGKLEDGKKVILCTPQSKLQANGNGWVDITTIQCTLLAKYDFPILAFRLEGSNIYYLNFFSLKPYLINQAIIENTREGTHWKLYIYPTYIKVLGNDKQLRITANSLSLIDSA